MPDEDIQLLKSTLLCHLKWMPGFLEVCSIFPWAPQLPMVFYPWNSLFLGLGKEQAENGRTTTIDIFPQHFCW